MTRAEEAQALRASGLSLREIACRMGLSSGTVGQYVYGAKHRRVDGPRSKPREERVAEMRDLRELLLAAKRVRGVDGELLLSYVIWPTEGMLAAVRRVREQRRVAA